MAEKYYEGFSIDAWERRGLRSIPWNIAKRQGLIIFSKQFLYERLGMNLLDYNPSIPSITKDLVQVKTILCTRFSKVWLGPSHTSVMERFKINS